MPSLTSLINRTVSWTQQFPLLHRMWTPALAKFLLRFSNFPPYHYILHDLGVWHNLEWSIRSCWLTRVKICKLYRLFLCLTLTSFHSVEELHLFLVITNGYEAHLCSMCLWNTPSIFLLFVRTYSLRSWVATSSSLPSRQSLNLLK